MRKLVPLAAGAAIFALGVPAVAQAATVRPTAHLVLASNQITAGSTARLSYATAGLPAGSVPYLQERAVGSGGGWKTAERTRRVGVITAPAAPAGQYAFRILVRDHGRTVTTSQVAYLTVRAKSGGGSVFGTIWSILGKAFDVVKWLSWLIGGAD